MSVDRRTFMKTLSAGIVFPYGLLGQENIDLLFDRSIVIDTLSVAHQWDDIAFKSIRESGYTAIQTTLPSPNLEVAVQALAEWNQRIKNHSDKLIRTSRVADIERAKEEGKMAVLFGFQRNKRSRPLWPRIASTFSAATASRGSTST